MSVEEGAYGLTPSGSGNQAAYLVDGDLWLAHFQSKERRQLTEFGRKDAAADVSTTEDSSH